MAVQEKDLALEDSARRAYIELREKIDGFGEDKRKEVYGKFRDLGQHPPWFTEMIWEPNYTHPSELSWLKTLARAYYEVTGQKVEVNVEGSNVSLQYEK